ncbi:hypothetical protein M407DRAFT_9360 [Tulasnella calospora MUT 4182]|uniref:Uncharacterized protein n=1 Tax=Tulasnella calospora MUT 4182 TaxID=1051891 RepID=A0A0C3LQ71_9AGAM|nr:hypothetical protein M407DRAFT_9360 [Tulasnella calospora MUT 4182]
MQQEDEADADIHPNIFDLDREGNRDGAEDSDDVFGDGEELPDGMEEMDGYGGPEMEVGAGQPFDDLNLGDGGTSVDLSCFWRGLPGGAEGNAVDDGGEHEGEAALVASAQVNDCEGSVSSRPSTPSTMSSHPPELLAPPSPHPELVRIWDLKAARHRKPLVCLDTY